MENNTQNSSQPNQAPSTSPQPPPDVSSIYPSLKPAVSPGTEQAPNQAEKIPVSSRVASIVPLSAFYAVLSIIYGSYIALLAYRLWEANNRLGQHGGAVAEILNQASRQAVILMVIISAIDILSGLYLLITKNLKNALTLLTALLIISVLNIMSSLFSLVRSASMVSGRRMISFAILVASLTLLWIVKNQVKNAKEVA